MSLLRWSTIAALSLAAAAQVASAQPLYKSVGADGKIVYSDKPPAAGAVEKTMTLESLPVSVVPGAAPRPDARNTRPEAPAAAAPRGDVVLYMATWCGYCKAAKAYLAQKSIPYRELDIDTPAGKAAFAQIGGRGVPVLLTQGKKLSGFSQKSYDAVFAARK